MGDQERKWNIERQSMQQHMKILSEQMEAQKKFQESLMNAINSRQQQLSPERKNASDDGKMKQKNKELLTTNQNLSQQIVQMQAKQMNLEKTIANLKQFKYYVHYALAI